MEKFSDLTNKKKNRKLEGIIKKWLLAVVDGTFFAFTNAIICYIVSGGKIGSSEYSYVLFNAYHLIITIGLGFIVNYLLRLYKSVWTFAGPREIALALMSAAINTTLLYLVDKIIFNIIYDYKILPVYAYFINFVFVTFFLCLPRLGYLIFKREIKSEMNLKLSKSKQRNLKRVMIVGAGYMSNTVIDHIKDKLIDRYIPVVAVDDNPAKRGKRINGIKIVGNIDEIPEIVKEYDIDEIVICIPSAPKKRINEIIKIAASTNKIVKTTPSMAEIIENGSFVNDIRKIEIADLLEREEIKLDTVVCKYLIDTTILVTGGGGSIGAEICNQCARYNPKTIIIFDIYENCAFELANDLKDKYGTKINIQVRIGSVRDTNRLNEIFEEFHPDVVFHAAAHKHVPLMEDSPCEAVKNNVFGTYNVAVTADKYKVPKMVILSTDKAVNPTNVMGCTKRITEMIIQYMNEVSDNTMYAAVRFGNVLGSHGSVIPIFEKQIEAGGPVCVTHPDITRYFMTIPEAAQLVCQAGGLAKGGEVFVLDMGQPVRIMDLAENLIKLSNHTVEEIGIKIVGLRPGEKLYEELSLDEEMETRQKTANKKIFVNQPMVIDYKKFETMLESLNDIDENNVREKLMNIVPNYHPSKND